MKIVKKLSKFISLGAVCPSVLFPFVLLVVFGLLLLQEGTHRDRRGPRLQAPDHIDLVLLYAPVLHFTESVSENQNQHLLLTSHNLSAKNVLHVFALFWELYIIEPVYNKRGLMTWRHLSEKGKLWRHCCLFL